jgi:hypothetical protein
MAGCFGIRHNHLSMMERGEVEIASQILLRISHEPGKVLNGYSREADRAVVELDRLQKMRSTKLILPPLKKNDG